MGFHYIEKMDWQEKQASFSRQDDLFSASHGVWADGVRCFLLPIPARTISAGMSWVEWRDSLSVSFLFTCERQKQFLGIQLCPDLNESHFAAP
jgi:hypothetical protein